MAHYQINVRVKALGRLTRLDVVIPSLNLGESLGNKDDNYYQNNVKQYPLIICLHGFGSSKEAFQENSSINALCEKRGVAACYINGDNKWYLNMGPIDDYYNLIERDVLDFLYGNFRCLSKDMPLAICGVSMGGYGALYHYLKNRDKYCCCAAMSPATKPDYVDESKYGTLKELFLATKGEKLNIYLSVGEKDFIIDASRNFDNFLKENGIDCSYKYIPDADHSWVTWGNQMVEVFDYIEKHLKK